jgi:hypothetical protein
VIIVLQSTKNPPEAEHAAGVPPFHHLRVSNSKKGPAASSLLGQSLYDELGTIVRNGEPIRTTITAIH